MTANFANQTIWTGDNLDVMRGMNSESVDLIYLDPPFNSSHDYAAPIGSRAAGAAFKDTWGLDDVNLAWHGEIKHDHPGLYDLLQATRRIHGDSMMSYLIYMAIRLMEMRRVLGGAGSIYLHCDDAAGHYLKLLMDSIFGAHRFRNCITWRRAVAHNDPGRYGRISDYLLFYTRGDEWTWNVVREPVDEARLKVSYPQKDKAGRRYRSDNLTGPMHGDGGGESAQEWRGYDVASRSRVWSPPRRGGYADYIEERWIPGYKSIGGVHARLDALDTAGLIVHPTTGFWPGLKRYAEADKGKPLQDILYTPTGLTNYSGEERIGYPTQKPLALLRRIVRASSNEDDMVFDPFAGCATACIAAQLEHRRWAGIDISSKAADLVKDRMEREVRLFFQGSHRTDIPVRTDLGAVIRYNDERNKRYLYGEQGGYCNGCEHHFEPRNFQVDHIIPKTKGGTDHISNLQLLCAACNALKGTRSHEELIVLLTDKGFIKRRNRPV